jgi:cell shape-determining protein MreD
MFAQVTGTARWSPAPALPLVLCMAVGDFSLARGVSLAFVLGYLADACAGGSMGLWTFTLVSVFLLARVAGLKLFLHGMVFQVALTYVASLVVGVEMLALLLVFDQRPIAVLAALREVALQSIATAACAPLVFAAVRRLPGATAERSGALTPAAAPEGSRGGT